MAKPVPGRRILVLVLMLGVVAGLVPAPVEATTRVATTFDATHPLNAPKVVNGVEYQYDANGNLLNDGERTIEWNLENKPRSVSQRVNESVIQLIYDGDGRRIIKSVKVSECQSVKELTPYLYTGQELDAETDLYNLNARLYNPTTGVFISPDEIGDPSSRGNRYQYAAGNPTNFSDPTGHCVGPLAIICVAVISNPAAATAVVMGGVGFLASLPNLSDAAYEWGAGLYEATHPGVEPTVNFPQAGLNLATAIGTTGTSALTTIAGLEYYELGRQAAVLEKAKEEFAAQLRQRQVAGEVGKNLRIIGGAIEAYPDWKPEDVAAGMFLPLDYEGIPPELKALRPAIVYGSETELMAAGYYDSRAAEVWVGVLDGQNLFFVKDPGSDAVVVYLKHGYIGGTISELSRYGIEVIGKVAD